MNIKKKIFIALITIIAVFLVFLFKYPLSGVASKNLASVQENQDINILNKEDSNKEDTNKDNEDSTNNNSKKHLDIQTDENTHKDDSIEDESAKDESVKDEIDLILNNALEGKVINSEFAAGKDSIMDVECKLGCAKEKSYVTEAKGEYSSYPLFKLAFGYNKGTMIFEARSFDDSIKNISLTDLKKILGKPDHLVINSKEHIVGYIVNKDYKLLFVFKNGQDEDNMMMDHYSVFYPDGTRNNMADDPGRPW